MAKRVLIAWPGEGEASLWFESDGHRLNAASMSAVLDEAQSAALDVAIAWGANPSQPVPAGWRLVPPAGLGRVVH